MTMKVTWAIESECFPDDACKLIAALDKAGIEYKILKRFGEDKNFINREDCVIYYGSLETAKYLRKIAKWIPGVYYNIDAFKCTNYYPALGDLLLNSEYIMMPFGELIRRKEFIYDTLGKDRTVFIRPNRGDKIFTGKLVYKEEFEKDINIFGFYNIDQEELVIISEPYNLRYEWRFVCVDHYIITGSQYRENGVVVYSPHYPLKALELAGEVAKRYSPDDVWIIDICETKGGQFKVMEVGCFSCCGLYECDRDIIVSQVSRVALREWQNYNEEL